MKSIKAAACYDFKSELKKMYRKVTNKETLPTQTALLKGKNTAFLRILSSIQD